MANTFKGGLHPFGGKELTQDMAPVELKPKGELVFPLKMHAGAPAVPVVKPGDTVLAGQLIAEAGSTVSANIHSSVSGKVKKIEMRPFPTGGKAQAIVIENDGEYTEVEYIKSDPEALSREELLEKIRSSGAIGMGGAGFPVDQKLSPHGWEDIKYLVINGAECEPYLTSDYRVMVDDGEKLISGIKIALKLLPNAAAVIGVEDNKPEAIKRLTALAAGEPKITVKAVKTKYPQGSDRTLTYATTGLKIKSTAHANEYGVVVSNVTSLYNVHEAVVEGRPLTRRIVTVSGDSITNPGNFRVYIGTAFSELLEAAGGTSQDPEKYINGGTMMGFAMYDLSAPITKTSASLLAFKKDEVSAVKRGPCIKCASCIGVCPMQLMPNKLAKLAEKGDAEEFEKLYGSYCIECGCCSYVCPARIPLKQSIKAMKAAVKAAKRRERR